MVLRDRRFEFEKSQNFWEQILIENNELKAKVKYYENLLVQCNNWWERVGKFIENINLKQENADLKNKINSLNSYIQKQENYINQLLKLINIKDQEIVKLKIENLSLTIIKWQYELTKNILGKNILGNEQKQDKKDELQKTEKNITQNLPINFSNIERNWLNILKIPFRAVIIGKSGSGKSALGHYLLEIFHYHKDVYILGFPINKIKLLPDYIHVIDSFDKLPMDSICLVDESYLFYYSRNSMTDDKNKKLLEILGLSRQKNCSLIFITQSTGLIERNILSLSDYIIIKEISFTQIEFERKEIKQILKKAYDKFEKIVGDKRRYSYVISTTGDFENLVENNLPTYWNEEISKSYSGGFLSGVKIGKKISNEEKREFAKQYRNRGYSYKQIAKILGVSKTTIINWTKHGK
ncbi:MAG: helix-turn-helix domain-containing protein [bacterium]|nr:helix-turn-helix domain-containing protein [bacterium]